MISTFFFSVFISSNWFSRSSFCLFISTLTDSTSFFLS
uniref:Uncharacterized protein n=1 Tax=Anguilla anguilla TaxID=7936 RepID=A0A0E9XMR1_ANGAN